MRFGTFAPLFLVAMAAANPPDKVYLSTDYFSSVIEIDADTGERRFLDLAEYPKIIKATDILVESEGTFIVDTYDAVQRVGFFRHNPKTGTNTPISGGVDGFDPGLLGEGPEFTFAPKTLLQETSHTIIAIQQFLGPVRVNLVTGERTILSQSEEPVVGFGYPITEPVDAVVPAPGRLWLMLAYDGIIDVDLSTGNRRMAFPNAVFTHVPARIDLLGRTKIVYTVNLPDEGAIYQYDTAEGQNSLLTGNFGGESRGEGEQMQMAGDIAVASDGMIWVFDPQGGRIFKVDPETGNRTVIARDEDNPEVPFWSARFRPTIAVRPPPPPSEGREGWIVY